jgi:CheY-like chemotaxis protein
MTVRPAKGRGEGVIGFAVQDSGIGIPLEKQKLIFEAFQQADGTTSRKYGGTGLGLTISREIARLLGGTIEVVSAPDRGSTFTLYLPRDYAGAEAREDAPVEEQGIDSSIPELPKNAAFDGRKILVVDDDLRNIFAIKSVLEARNITVYHAENGKLALELLEKNSDVDLVLMDTMMPELDGLAATRSIRQVARYAELPIISLTAKAMMGDREKALEAGASDYVAKPVDPEKLLAVIHLWLRRAAQARAAN